MNIFEKIIENLKDIDLKITDIRIGLSYCGVLLENGNLGLAYTFLPKTHRCSSFDSLWPIKGKRVCDLVESINQDDIGSAVLLACANAFHNIENKSDYIHADILKVLDIRNEDVVGMVGDFRPLVTPLKSMCKKLYIFEKKEDRDKDVLPEQEAYSLLKKCDVTIITATSLINKTLDSLLKNIEYAREIVVLGPSTPLNINYFKNTKVTLLSGVIVKDPNVVLDIISVGGGMRRFNKFVSKVSVRCK